MSATKKRRKAGALREKREPSARPSTSGRVSQWLEGRPSLEPPSVDVAWPYLLVGFVLVFGVYAWSASRTVVLEDDGEFVSVVYLP